MSTIIFACSQCAQHVEVPESMKNQTLICPLCHKITTVSTEKPVPPRTHICTKCGTTNPENDYLCSKCSKVLAPPRPRPAQRKCCNPALVTLLALIGTVAGVLIVRVFFLDSTQVTGWNMFWNALSHGDIRNAEMVFKSATFAKCVAGLVVCSGVGLLTGIAIRK